MKNSFLNKYTLLFSLLIIFQSCKKGVEAVPEFVRPVRVEFKGLVLNDSLELISAGKVIGKAFETEFRMSSVYYNPNELITVRRIADKKVFAEFQVTKAPFKQVKILYYDGVTLADNLALTPVTNPANVGVRLRFSSSFKDVFKGPVDVEIFDTVIDWDTWQYTYISVKTVTGVNAVFGDFFELPPLQDETHSYMYRVYKSGTKEPPFTDLKDVIFEGPSMEYGELIGSYSFTGGDSRLLSLSPQLSMTDREIVTGYTAIDFSAPFK